MKKKIKIQGMHCASCASNTERSLKKVPGVKEVSVSLMTNKAIVELSQDVSEESLKQAVSKAGYKVVSID